METRGISYLEEVIRLTQYTGYAVQGLLAFLKRQMCKHMTSSVETHVLPNIEKIDRGIAQILFIVDKLSAYAQYSESSDSIKTRLGLSEYLDHEQLQSKNILSLTEALFSFFLRLVDTKYPLAAEDREKAGYLSLWNLYLYHETVHPKLSMTSKASAIPGSDNASKGIPPIGHLQNWNYEEEKGFVHYLVKKGVISAEEFTQAVHLHRSKNQSFGQIAIQFGFLLPQDVENLLKTQYKIKLKFGNKIKKKLGDLAVQMGMMDSGQMQTVIQFQLEHYVSLVSLLVEQKMVSQEMVNQEWKVFNDFLKFNRENFSSGQCFLEEEGNITNTKSVFDFYKTILDEIHAFQVLFFQEFPESANWSLQHDLVPFKDLLKLVLQNARFVPAPLWGEFFEIGIFMGRKKIANLDDILRNTHYFKKRLLACDSMDKKINAIRSFSNIRKFITDTVLNVHNERVSGVPRPEVPKISKISSPPFGMPKIKKLEPPTSKMPLIPRKDREDGPIPKKEPLATPSSGRAISVILVDDDRSFYDQVSEMLDPNVYDLVYFESPGSVLKEISRLKADIILLDYEMPGANGVEVLKHIKAMRADIPVVLITGNPSMQIAVSALKSGAHDCLDKPFSKNSLISKIGEICKK